MYACSRLTKREQGGILRGLPRAWRGRTWSAKSATRTLFAIRLHLYVCGSFSFCCKKCWHRQFATPVLKLLVWFYRAVFEKWKRARRSKTGTGEKDNKFCLFLLERSAKWKLHWGNKRLVTCQPVFDLCCLLVSMWKVYTAVRMEVEVNFTICN